MKRFKSLLFLTVLIALPLIYFTACSDKSEVNGPNQINFDSPQFAIIDYFDVENAIEDGTIDKEIVINNNLIAYSFMNYMNPMTPGNPMLRGNPWLEKFDFGKHLGIFFRRLHLSDEQKIKSKELMVKFHNEMKPLVVEFKDANADIIKAANQARKLILEDLKVGKFTRELAASKLKALNEETRDKIKSNPKTVEVKTKMCDARANLFTEIVKILTPEQLEKWNNFSSKIPNPCK